MGDRSISWLVDTVPPLSIKKYKMTLKVALEWMKPLKVIWKDSTGHAIQWQKQKINAI